MRACAHWIPTSMLIESNSGVSTIRINENGQMKVKGPNKTKGSPTNYMVN